MSHQQPPPPPSSICILEGSMAKMKRHQKLLTGRWNKRWVMLTNDALEWRHSKDGDARGRIQLDDVEKIYKLKSLSNKSNKPAKKKRRGGSSSNATILIVKTKERNLCLSAQGGDDCDRWYRAIQMQLDLREGGTVSGPRGTRNRRQSNGGGDKYKRMVDAAKNLESDLPPIPTTIEGSFSGDDLNNISDLDVTFASSCFLGGQGDTSNAQQGSSVACMLLAGDSGGTESDASSINIIETNN